MLDGIPEDLREMDEKQFVEVFNLLRSKTKDWAEFSPELLIENNQFLLVVRCGVGLSQEEFGTKLGTNKQWVKDIEAGRSKIIHLKPANRWIGRIVEIMSHRNVSLEVALLKFEEFKRFRHDIKLKKENKPITKLKEEDILELLNNVKNETKNFTLFSPLLIMRNPRTLLIFRLLLGMSHKKFANLLGMNDRVLRNREKGIESVGLKMSGHILEKLTEVMKNRTIEPDMVLENFRLFKNFLHNDVSKDIFHGLNFARNLKLSEIELEISELLKKNNIQFHQHSIVNGLKRPFNVDFVVPNETFPKSVIEAFSFSLKKPLGFSLRRIREMDHRFQMIKAKDNSIKTFLCVKLKDREIVMNKVHEFLDLEILNTDHFLINEEINTIPNLL